MEHQTLQVQNYKKSNYKWVDDSLVSECTQCKKSFTVTNRKVNENLNYIFLIRIASFKNRRLENVKIRNRDAINLFRNAFYIYI